MRLAQTKLMMTIVGMKNDFEQTKKKKNDFEKKKQQKNDDDDDSEEIFEKRLDQ